MSNLLGQSKASLGGAVDKDKKLLTDSSSLVDLKAEVYRKRQEAAFNKLHGKKPEVVRPTSGKAWSKNNAGVQLRRERDEEAKAETARNEAKVKEALDRKTKATARASGVDFSSNTSCQKRPKEASTFV